ncbi:hypothetical protein D3C80_2128960 [compost metagenome]
MLFAVFDSEGDMVDRSGTLTGKWRFRKSNKVNRVGSVATGNDKPGSVTFHFSAFIPHEAEEFCGGSRIV